MNIVIKPIVHMMEKFNFAKRFILISVIIFASLLILSFMYVDTKLADRQFVVDEMAPAQYYEVISNLTKKLEASRKLHSEIANKTIDANTSTTEVDNAVDVALANLKDHSRRNWTTEKVNQQIQLIENNWAKLRASLEKADTAELYVRNQEILVSLSNLLLTILDESNLDLDINPLTSNLIDIFMKFGPHLSERTVHLRDIGVSALLKREIDQKNRDEIQYLLGLQDYENNRFEESTKRIMDIDNTFSKTFSSALDVIDNSSVSSTIKHYLFQSVIPENSVGDFSATMNNYINNYHAMCDAAYKTFVIKQQERIKAIDTNIMQTVACLLAVFIAICLLFMAFYRSTSQAVLMLVKSAEVIASGDLTQNIEMNRHDEFGMLMRVIGTMQTKLREIVNQIKKTSNTVSKGTAEISQGNLDLSKRTEEQASSLASTAASMQELSLTVRENAEQSKKASALAENARKQADSSGVVVNDAVSAMAQINNSSKKIAEISGVIDEIAFQTNLLALNAAIEAARAGEQGRGFAVVAQEVRNLAQRSGAAAKEINTLISESVEKISSGTELVNKSGEALQQIVKSSFEVSELVTSIAGATTQQSIGLEEINKAITQMDGITQQNAALVEETAATSENVNERVRDLIRQIDFFKETNNGNPEPFILSKESAVNLTSKLQPTENKSQLSTDETKHYYKQPERKGTDQDWSEF